MRILAFETSGPDLSAALVRDGIVVAQRAEPPAGFTHSERLMPLVSALLAETGTYIRDIDVFAASSGPGSFTGVRIGIVCAKAMAYALGKMTAGVPTLDVVAMNAIEITPRDSQVCVAIDARNAQVYSGIFRFEAGSPVLSGSYMAGSAMELAAKLRDLGVRTILVGSGASKYRRELTESASGLFLPPIPDSDAPQAAMAGLLAYAMSLKKELSAPADLVPLYIRKIKG